MFRHSTASTRDSSTNLTVTVPPQPTTIPVMSSAATKFDKTSSMITSLKSTVCAEPFFSTSTLNTKSQLQGSHAKSKINGLGNKHAARATKATLKNRIAKYQENLRRAVANLTNIDELPQPSASKPTSSTPNADASPAARPHPTLTACDFELGGSLGRGKFGRASLARHININYICALKIISKAQCASASEEKLIRRELEIHQNLAHKNILKLVSWFHDDKSIYLVLEYAAGGSLYSRLKKQPKGRFDEKTTATFIVQIALALRYMHSKNIIHRDIKPENNLLGLQSDIKLADFGYRYSVHSESGLRSTVCGTLDYLSPEVALMLLKPGKSEEYYTKAIDQWSLGVLTHELLTGRPPFETKSGKAKRKKIARFNGKGLKFPGHISQGTEEHIKEVRASDQEKLPTCLDNPLLLTNGENSCSTLMRRSESA
ncbi:hypothetical protein IAQ61_000348 [Plenodomus lingam]|uniref:uncharacterized protein n=1 Tax=Leptosphaeria maculans TaxID=5022 RepID=UPI003324D172|nr:hypothetical protein IAQ61_000348 [Plenodomus lingam]